MPKCNKNKFELVRTQNPQGAGQPTRTTVNNIYVLCVEETQKCIWEGSEVNVITYDIMYAYA